MAFNKVSILVAGAGSATLATAITNANTAVSTAVTNALAVTNSANVEAKMAMLFDGTLYVGYANVSYTVTS